MEGFDPHVFSSGKPNADLMFVGEAPGRTEVEQRRPFVGTAGQFFERSILFPSGLERNSVYITNSVLCRPTANRTPFFGEIEECLEHLDAQVLLVSPKLIVTLGSVALFGVCAEQGITKKRGALRWSRQWSDGRRVPVLPMFHPAYCLRGLGLTETTQDVQLLASLVAALAVGRKIVVP